MTQMAFTSGTEYFCADHTMGGVYLLYDRFVINRCPKAWPARAALIFGLAFEQRCFTRGTYIGAGCFGVPVLATERGFCAAAAAHLVLLRRQFCPPVILCFCAYVVVHQRTLQTKQTAYLPMGSLKLRKSSASFFSSRAVFITGDIWLSNMRLVLVPIVEFRRSATICSN